MNPRRSHGERQASCRVQWRPEPTTQTQCASPAVGSFADPDVPHLWAKIHSARQYLPCVLFHRRYAIHLHENAKKGGSHRGTGRRLVPEKLSIHFVELREPGEVGHVGVYLHDVVQAGSRRLQDRSKVLECLMDLVCEGVGYGSRLRVYGTLARDEHEALGNYGVGVRTSGSRSSVGHHGFPHPSSFLEVVPEMKLSSAKTPHEQDDSKQEEIAYLRSTGVHDHLFDHLSVSVQGVPCGSTDLPKSGNRLSVGVPGGLRAPT